MKINNSQELNDDAPNLQDQAVLDQNYSTKIISAESELKGAKGCCRQTALFTKYAIQDVTRNKCHFCLAFCSVLIVVLSVLVVNTIV